MASTDPVKSDNDEETQPDEAEARVDADEESAGADEATAEADSTADAEPDADEDDGESDEDADEDALDEEEEAAAADSADEAPAKPAKKKGKGRSKDGMTAGARLAAAKAAKAARKAAKRGKEIKEQDPIAQVRETELAKRVEEAGSWAAKNRTAVIAVVAAIVIGLGGWLGWRSYQSSQAEAAGALLADAVEIAHAEIVPEEEETEDTAEDAEADADAPPTFPTEQARAEAALEAYRGVVSQYPNADAAVWARLGEADALAELGQLEEAREAYQAAEREGGTNPTVVWRALEGRAFTLEAEEKWDDALAVYEQLAALDNHRYQPVANYHIARMYMAKGETDRAKETLQTVVDTLNEAADDEDEQDFAYALAQAQTRLHTLDPSAAPPPRPTGVSPFGGMGGPGGNLTPEQMQELIRRFQQQQQQGGGAE